MTDTNNHADKKIININLDSLLVNIQTRLQHLSDLVKFSCVAASSAKEEDYLKYGRFFNFDIAQNRRLNFSEAKERFEQWCLINSFRSSVECLGIFLEEVYIICELIKRSNNKSMVGALFNAIIGPNKKSFHGLGLPDKITKLKKNYNFNFSLEAHILSLNRARNCLVHRLGIVSEQDTDPSGMLITKFREFQLVVLDPDSNQEIIINEPTTVEKGGHVGIRITDYERKFKLGERIIFNHEEHIKAISTFFFFGQEVHKSVCQYVGIKIATPEIENANITLERRHDSLQL